MLDNHGSISGKDNEGIFSFFATASRPALGPSQPPIQWVPGNILRGIKRSGREADHSSLPSTEVKNVWSYTSTPTHLFMAWYLIKHRDNVTFLLYMDVKLCVIQTEEHRLRV
jgi:hypothetical protein